MSIPGWDTRSTSLEKGNEYDIATRYAELPLMFEVNQGQADASVKFLSRTRGATVLLTANETVLSLNKPAAAVRMQLVDANPAPETSGVDVLPGKSNYFIGSNPQKWVTDVSTYAKVRYEDVYPGIDMLYYGNRRQLEYDFIVSPGADPKAIRFGITGVDDVELDSNGDLLLRMPGGDIRQHKPVIYQETEEGRVEIPGGYVLGESREVTFQIASYDSAKSLVIDPVMSYSTYFGGNGIDLPTRIVVDSSGNMYVGGITTSTDFPRTGPIQATLGGGSGEFLGDPADMFVTKINAAGSAVMYSTYLGGAGDDFPSGLAIDASGNLYIGGATESANFPVTTGAFTTSKVGGSDAIVAKINPSGSALVYSTYLGSAGEDQASAIAVDTSGNVYVAGYSEGASDFPTTIGAYQRAPAASNFVSEAFITKFNAAGSTLLYSTYIGGNGVDQINDVTIDAEGNAYAAGETRSSNFPTTSGAFQTTSGGGPKSFVLKMNPAGSTLVFSTYLGGNIDDRASSIAIDEAGSVYVAGGTLSSSFPTTEGAVQRTYGGSGQCGLIDFLNCGDAFVTKLNPTGTQIVYSTYLGGSGADFAMDIGVTSGGAAFVVGSTNSANFPLTTPVQADKAGAAGDMFVTNLDSSGALYYSTYLGGTGEDAGLGIAIDGTGTAWMAGITLSTDFPTASPLQAASGGGLADAFITKITGGTIGTGGSTTGGNTGGGTTGGGFSGGFSIANPGGLSVISEGSGELRVGYARIAPSSGSSAPSGVAIFGFRQNNVLVTEAGVPATPPVQAGRIYAEVSGPVNTGLAIANPNSQAAAISFYFTDQNGANFGADSTTIPANGQVAAFLNQSPFNGGSSINGTFTFSSSVPVGVIALRGLTNERNEFLITTLPVSPLSAPLNEIAYFAHFANGGGWSTQVVLINPTDDTMTGSVQFVGQGALTAPAQPVTVSIDGQTNSTFSYTIPARSSRRLPTSGAGATIQVGSVRVTPTSGGRTPSGLAVFSFKNAGVTVAEAGVPAGRAGTAFRMYVEASAASTGSIQTGIAMTNSTAAIVFIAFDLTRLDGTSAGSASYLVPANGQVALFLNQIPGFKELPVPFQGVLRMSTSGNISVVGLRGRYNERGDFLITTTPPVDEISPSVNTELIFPHLADGGGYTTQFVLFSGQAGQASSGTLRTFTQAGAELNLTLR